jgi:nucleoside-diphosphate-sugar epimerase
MKIFITGICGFVASNIAKKLIDEGYEVHGCDDLSFGTIDNLRSLGIYDKVKLEIKSFQSDFYSISKENDIIIHCATSNIIYAQNHRQETIFNNYNSTKFAFECIQNHKKVIYISTSSVYGNSKELPTTENAPIKLSNIYAETKWLAEQVLLERNKNACILRLSNVYGINQRHTNPYCGVIGKMIHTALSQSFVDIIGNGEQTRDFTYVEDVCDAVLLAIEKDAKGIYNVSAMNEMSIQDVALNLVAETSNTITFNSIKKRSIDTVDRRFIDSTKIQTELGWKPKHTFQEGLQKTIDWYIKENA